MTIKPVFPAGKRLYVNDTYLFDSKEIVIELCKPFDRSVEVFFRWKILPTAIFLIAAGLKNQFFCKTKYITVLPVR
jgi:hypothetical protein